MLYYLFIFLYSISIVLLNHYHHFSYFCNVHYLRQRIISLPCIKILIFHTSLAFIRTLLFMFPKQIWQYFMKSTILRLIKTWKNYFLGSSFSINQNNQFGKICIEWLISNYVYQLCHIMVFVLWLIRFLGQHFWNKFCWSHIRMTVHFRGAPILRCIKV